MEKLDLDKYLKELESLINIDSRTYDIKDNCKVADFFTNKFKEIGYTTETKYFGRLERPMLIATNKELAEGEKYDFLLIGHMDTVSPEDKDADRHFHIIEDKAYGPGTVDMKGADLLITYICEYLKKAAPNISICVGLNSDEEIGSPDTKGQLVDLGSKSKRCFVFEAARKQGEFVNERKGIIKYKLDITGIPSHAGAAPQLGASAIVELGNWIVTLDKQKNYAKGTSINVGIIEGGIALNVIADKAMAMIEVRYTDYKEFLRVQKKIGEMKAKHYVDGTTAKITEISHYRPFVINDETKKLMKIMNEAGKAMGRPIEYVKAGGISDANRIAHLGLPIIDGCGPSGGFPHTKKEFLLIPSVEERFELITQLMVQIKKSSK
ncbi:MAG: M20 family metallopeptidase [Anaerovoracaceae bacterium]